MDAMIQAYMEDTEDMLQKAEECIIRLEMEYSAIDVNELFRIAHTIKGSSSMVGYDDIANLMHKIEDMLDCARNGTLLFNQSIVTLCFDGLDTVKRMLQAKKESSSAELMDSLVRSALKTSNTIKKYIEVNKKEEIAVHSKPVTGIVSSMLNKGTIGKNKYYIKFFIEEDAPMISPIILIVLKSVEDIGSLLYSSVADDFFSDCSTDGGITDFDIIISTDIDEAELYTYFALFSVEKINIVDISRNKLEVEDHCFKDTDNIHYITIVRAFIKLYKLLFDISKEHKVNKKALKIIETLHGEVTTAFEMMKNKNKIGPIINDIDELNRLALRIHDGNADFDRIITTNLQAKMLKHFEKIYIDTKGKQIFSVFKSDKNNFISRLKHFIILADKSTIIVLLINVSKLDIVREDEIKDLIEIKRQLTNNNIEIKMIADRSSSRRIINIFDSIETVEKFKVFGTELDAVKGMLDS